MSHAAQREYCRRIKARFPMFFTGCRVLDVGSLDINGNNRGLFVDCDYLGIDLAPGANVDRACRAHECDAPDESFDVVLSTEALEHDRFFDQTLRNMQRLFRPAGLLFFTCATTGRAEHGTARASPQDSPLTSRLPEWCNYYRNLTEDDIRQVWDVVAVFESFEFESDPVACDLRFWGLKRPV